MIKRFVKGLLITIIALFVVCAVGTIEFLLGIPPDIVLIPNVLFASFAGVFVFNKIIDLE